MRIPESEVSAERFLAGWNGAAATMSALDDEEILRGGVANAGAVVRVGPHVLRPSNSHTPTIHAFLGALRAAGFDGVQEPVGVSTPTAANASSSSPATSPSCPSPRGCRATTPWPRPRA